MALPGLFDRGAFFVSPIGRHAGVKCRQQGLARLRDERRYEMDYLTEHPNAMPVREAAMTYLFSDVPPVLRLVPAPRDDYPEVTYQEPEARGA
jgi:methionine synthase II (cobalamin-independent)